MGCARGEASPNTHTKLKLFADSGGYCQNPSCNVNLFLVKGDSDFHVAEMAHIISAGEKGPRSRLDLTKSDKGNFSNLILLCPNCHTMIDKAEAEFPDSLIQDWKFSHSRKINELFNIKPFATRYDVRGALVPIFNENKTIFDIYGPLSEERFNPESEMPRKWILKICQNILPNNRKIIGLIDKNYSKLTEDEIRIVEIFRQHMLDFEDRHINNGDTSGIRFPDELNTIFEN